MFRHLVLSISFPESEAFLNVSCVSMNCEPTVVHDSDVQRSSNGLLSGAPSTSDPVSEAPVVKEATKDHEWSIGSMRIPVDVSLCNCSIDIVSGKYQKTILKPVTTTIEGGSLFGILGGSGSGKTTLLNVIAGRYSSRSFKIGGRIVLSHRSASNSSANSSTPSNGSGINAMEMHTNIGYVTQADYLLPYLTVRETLLFAARMKVPRLQNATYAEHRATLQALIDEVIQDLGIRECADVAIGSSDPSNPFSRRGLSGGEKRRVSIAIQIITDPRGAHIVTLIAVHFHLYLSTLLYCVSI